MKKPPVGGLVDSLRTGLRIDEIHCLFVSVERIMSAFILISCLIRSNSIRTIDDIPHITGTCPGIFDVPCSLFYQAQTG